MITHSHNINLAVAAIVVSIVAAITGLALMNNIRSLPEIRRKAVIVMGAFLLGGGIWSMHFLAMLSVRFAVPIHYDLLQTLSSGLIAVLMVGLALLLLHFRERTAFVLNTAGVCLGMGIVLMHIVGMLGMRGVIPVFNVAALSMAVVLALIMGIAAVRVSYGSRSRQNIVKGGVLFGLSVVVVHYMAMVGTHFSVDPDYQQKAIVLDQGALAIVITIAAFLICGTFLLAASTFVPSGAPALVSMVHTGEAELQSPANEYREIDPERSSLPASGLVSTPEQTITTPTDPEEYLPTRDREDVGKSHAKKPRIASERSLPPTRQDDSRLTEPQRTSEILVEPAGAPVFVKIPYEQQKQIFFIDSHNVGAIRADGRYTQLYTRDGVKFCPWSITEAQKRLTGARFYRSHRSYLINMLAITSFEKNRDSGVCRFEGFTQLSNVPVSRSRVADLVSEMGL